MKIDKLFSGSSRVVAFAALGLLFILISSHSAAGQRRDYMTEAEADLVRENQEIDLRIGVLIKMIDRRLSILKIDTDGWTPPVKETEKWGEEPKGTRGQLLRDIRSLMQKAVDDIDNVVEHDKDALTPGKPSAKIFAKAVRALGTASRRYSVALGPLVDAAKDEAEKGSILGTLELAEMSIDSVSKLPADGKTDAKKNKN